MLHTAGCVKRQVLGEIHQLFQRIASAIFLLSYHKQDELEFVSSLSLEGRLVSEGESGMFGMKTSSSKAYKNLFFNKIGKKFQYPQPCPIT